MIMMDMPFDRFLSLPVVSCDVYLVSLSISISSDECRYVVRNQLPSSFNVCNPFLNVFVTI